MNYGLNAGGMTYQTPTMGQPNFFQLNPQGLSYQQPFQSPNQFALGNQLQFGANTAAVNPASGFFGSLKNGVGNMWDGFTNMGANGWSNVVGGASALGGMYLGNKALKQGQKEFKFNKKLAQTNLANQAKLINTSIERRARSNAHSAGLTGSEADQFINDRTQRESVRGTI